MAYAATELQEARAFYDDVASGRFQTNELRRPIINTTRAFMDSTPFSVLGGKETLEKIKKSGDQTTKVPILTKLTADNGTARTCATSGAEGDTALTTLSYTTYVEKFKISTLMLQNNDISYQTTLRHLMNEKMRILMQRLETNLAAYLESSHATTSGAETQATIGTFTGDIGIVALADKNEYFSRLTTAMMQNNFAGPYQHVHSMGLSNRIMLQQNEGSGNSNNLAPQQQGFTHYGANLVPTTGSTEGTSFVFVPGTVGLLSYNNVLHRNNTQHGDDIWTTIANPFMPGLTFDLKSTTACTDNSGTSTHRGADLVTYFELVLEFSRYKAYTSDGDTGIYKFQLADA